MKSVCTFVFILLCSHAIACEIPLTQIREDFSKATVQKNECVELEKALETCKAQEPVKMGYYGAVMIMRAKYEINPISKYNYFKNGRSILEQALAVSENNLELRYLRHAIQTNIPSFLGYKDDIAADREFLIQNVYSETDTILKQQILSYLNQS
jgi:hypothetical protein